jgi:hypothetical protein
MKRIDLIRHLETARVRVPAPGKQPHCVRKSQSAEVFCGPAPSGSKRACRQPTASPGVLSATRKEQCGGKGELGGPIRRSNPLSEQPTIHPKQPPPADIH